MPCAELEIWEVGRTAAVRTGPCTRVFPEHSLSRALCARNCLGAETGLVTGNEEEPGPMILLRCNRESA